MLSNYFKIAFRHLTKHKLFSVINIFCLAIGITFSFVIGIYIIHEKEVNSKIKNLHNQYIIKSKWKQEAMGSDITTLAPLAKTMKEEYPDLVANYYRSKDQNLIVSVGEKHFKEDVAVCDTTLVSMFGFPILYGNKNSAFINNKSAVVTESFALKYFGKKDVTGREVQTQTEWGLKYNYVITTVLKDIPENTVTDFYNDKKPNTIFIPIDHNGYSDSTFKDWAYYNVPSMIELKSGVKPEDLSLPFTKVLALHAPNVFKGNLEVELAGLKDYYLKMNKGTVEKMIRTLSIIAFFILLMAVINFINIKIGTSAYRLKEMGLRKVFGSEKKHLIIQHLSESFLLTLVSAVLSLIFYELLRPVFFQLLNTTFDHIWEFTSVQTLIIVFLIIIVSLISGIYPAFILSSSNVINAVRGKPDKARGGLLLRQTLLVVQFTLAIAVFISAINISKQISYFLNKDLGYKKDQLLILSSLPKIADSTWGVQKMETFRKELSDIPGVKTASLSFEIPNGEYADNLNLIPEGANNNQVVSIPYLVTDEKYAETYGLQLKEGRYLRESNDSIPTEVVLNESAVKAFGWSSAIGKKVKLAFAGFWVTVVGVVKDFNFFSLHKKVEPLAFLNVNAMNRYQYFSIRFQTNNISKTIASLQHKWKSFFPEQPFEYSFMDEKLKSLYKSELQLKMATDIAAVMNLIIVFLGVFGVVAFTLAKRTKEIAVRKVLGADIRNIIMLFIKHYTLLLLIANVIAWPTAYLIINKWLENYAYRIHQDVIPFLFAGLFTFITASVLIAAQCFKVARSNPVNALKYE